MPVPKYACQTRLTNDARRRRRLAIDQPVRERQPVRRRVRPAAGAGRPARPARPRSPGLRKSPRFRTCVSRGWSRACSTSCDRPFRDAAATGPRSRRWPPSIRAPSCASSRRRRRPAPACACPAGRPGCRGRAAGSGSATAFGVVGDARSGSGRGCCSGCRRCSSRRGSAQLERQHRPVREGDRLLEHEDGLARHVAAAGAGVDAPGRVVLAVDGERRPAR